MDDLIVLIIVDLLGLAFGGMVVLANRSAVNEQVRALLSESETGTNPDSELPERPAGYLAGEQLKRVQAAEAEVKRRQAREEKNLNRLLTRGGFNRQALENLLPAFPLFEAIKKANTRCHEILGKGFNLLDSNVINAMLELKLELERLKEVTPARFPKEAQTRKIDPELRRAAKEAQRHADRLRAGEELERAADRVRRQPRMRQQG